jgi:hypothetical protein
MPPAALALGTAAGISALLAVWLLLLAPAANPRTSSDLSAQRETDRRVLVVDPHAISAAGLTSKQLTKAIGPVAAAIVLVPTGDSAIETLLCVGERILLTRDDITNAEILRRTIASHRLAELVDSVLILVSSEDRYRWNASPLAVELQKAGLCVTLGIICSDSLSASLAEALGSSMCPGCHVDVIISHPHGSGLAQLQHAPTRTTVALPTQASCNARGRCIRAYRLQAASHPEDAAPGDEPEHVCPLSRMRPSLRVPVSGPVILTVYFASKEDPQRTDAPRRGSRVSYLGAWFESVVRLQLSAVVLHDHLSEDLTKRLEESDPKRRVHFVRVKLGDRSTNDARFVLFRELLEENRDITHALITDISDVVLLRNPFELMDMLDQRFSLFVGSDIAFFENMGAIGWLQPRLHGCFGDERLATGDVSQVMELSHVYNAGVIGGRRSAMLAFLQAVEAVLSPLPPAKNCNMPVVNYVLHRYFHGRTFTGFPLNSPFMLYHQRPAGVYIVHK